MKRFLILMLLFSSFVQAQSQNLNQIKEQLKLANSESSFNDLANKLEKIAQKNTSSWDANYHTAYAFIELANYSDKKSKDALCDKAEIYLNKAVALNGDEVEELVLKAYLLSAKIKANPMFRGASLGKESKEYLNKALAMAPNNPRANLVRGMGIYNTPSLFGGGKNKAKPYLEKAEKNFNKTNTTTTNNPDWGVLQLNEMLESYK